jgi:PTH1 family peptidyl-tRNA hydrolase
MPAVDAVIVGLGNPGPRYAFTRHNIGFLALDVLARQLNFSFESSSPEAKRFKADYAQTSWAGKNVILLKPQTFMNLSGESLRMLYERRSDLRPPPGGQGPVPLIVLHDEADLPFGKVRVKLGGGDAGQNGLRSIRSALGHGDFYRVRLGVGRPPPESKLDLADWVLQSFSRDDEKALMEELERGLNVVEALLTKDLNAALTAASKQ